MKRKIVISTLIIVMSFLVLSASGCQKSKSDSKSVSNPELTTDKELTMPEKIAIATFQGGIRTIADGDNDTYMDILESFTVTDVSIKQYKKSEASSELLKIIANEEYGDLLIKDEATWIVCASYNYIDKRNTLIEIDGVYASVFSDGSAEFGKGVTYSQFGESTISLFYEDVYNHIDKQEDLDIDSINENLKDNSISIEVQKYIRSFE